MSLSIHTDPDMIQRMEDDLRNKIQVAINCNPDLNMVVHGVFSIEDLEQKLESEMGGAIGVGVGYMGCERKEDQKPARGNAASIATFSFTTILAVPTSKFSDERHPATKLLSLVRNSIIGQPVGDDTVQRVWDFVREQAEPSASTPTMLYYSQVWQLTLPIVGKTA